MVSTQIRLDGLVRSATERSPSPAAAGSAIVPLDGKHPANTAPSRWVWGSYFVPEALGWSP